MVPVHALLVVVAALLTWRLWGALCGALAGLLLALEPFLVAHGRILRTDALLAELMLVAVLAALAFWSRRAGGWALAVCTAATALALLTKTPALALLGAIPAAALAGVLQRAGRSSPDTGAMNRAPTFGSSVGARFIAPVQSIANRPSPLATHRSQLVARLSYLVVWLLGSAALVVALWPAMWARPLRALERMAVYTQEKGGSPMDAGGFFLGAPVPDPGPLYYAVALPLRLGPLVLIGLALWLLLRAPRLRKGVGLVLLIGLGLGVVLALLPKKADRYILPVIPFLAVVAAVGIVALAERWRRLSPAGALGLVAVVETTLLVMAWPYPLAAYDPLLGGGPTAVRWISVGWGEGLDQLAPVLNERPDAAYLTVSTPYPEVLQAQIVGRAVDLDAYDIADYAVRYIAASQRHLTTPALDAVLAGREPLRRVEIDGIPYAELYELDHPSFAGDVQVRQLEVSPSVTPRRGLVTVRMSLGPASAEGRTGGRFLGLTPFVTPIDVDVALVSAANPADVQATVTRSLLADGTLSEVKVRAPNGLGRYVVAIGIRDSASSAQFVVTSWPVGAPRVPDRLVFPSLSVRVQ
jgi:hypothetical protein